MRTGEAPTAEQRAAFRYPELRVTWQPDSSPPATRRAWAKPQWPGIYATTVTQPDFFRPYLLEQLDRWWTNTAPPWRSASATRKSPIPTCSSPATSWSTARCRSPADLARHFPTPMLSAVGDEVADGLWDFDDGRPRPLALFDAVRVDYSLRRLVHYTGTDWRAMQPWILLTNYQRYVDQFVRWGWPNWRTRPARTRHLVLPGGGGASGHGDDPAEAEARIAAAPWHRFQMPAYHLPAPTDGRAASPSSTSASAPPTPRTSPTTSRCCGRIAG